MKRGEPRIFHGQDGISMQAHEYQLGTWMEVEGFCYPGGGMQRRARALHPDGKARIVRCGVPDSAYTAPAVGGFVMVMGDGALHYVPNKGPVSLAGPITIKGTMSEVLEVLRKMQGK